MNHDIQKTADNRTDQEKKYVSNPNGQAGQQYERIL
jgi:hypothetical protein